MTQDLKSQLSFKGLLKGFEHPLIKFRGRLVDYEPLAPDQWDNIRVAFNFIEVDVIESREPYLLPIAQILVKYSKREGSAWGILADSIPEEMDIPNLLGKMQEWWFTPDHKLGKNRQTQEDIIIDAWECVAVEGVATPGAEKVAGTTPPASGPTAAVADTLNTPSAMDKVLEHLDGKNDQQFAQAALADLIIKADGNLQSSILQNTLIPSLITAGVVTKDTDGVNHVVKK